MTNIMTTNDWNNQGPQGLNFYSPNIATNYFTTYAPLENTFLDAYPEVNILYNKNRRKKFVDKVYLEDNNEFELEFFNPSSSTLGMLIELNGTLISQSHLVIKPGQRIILDRFIDTKDKFKFSTYEVEKSEAVKKAIKDNGKIKIVYYKEKQVQKLNLNGNSGINFINWNYGTSPYQNIGSTCTYTNNNADNNINLCASNIENNVPLETGRIDKGNKSDQTFELSYTNFNDKFSFSETLFILPLSQKPIEPKDLIRHCTQCSTKLKKEWKFCANCGTSTEQKDDEIILEIFYEFSSDLNISKGEFKLNDFKTDVVDGLIYRALLMMMVL